MRKLSSDNDNYSIRSHPPIGDKTGGAVCFATNVPRKTIIKYRNNLEPMRKSILMKSSSESPSIVHLPLSKIKGNSIFKLLKRGNIENNINNYIKNQKLTDDLFIKLTKDPLIYSSCATSAFVHSYTPLHAKKKWTRKRLRNELIYPTEPTQSSAFVLPTGHVINKAYGMTYEDLVSHIPANLKQRSVRDLNITCTETFPVSRVNLYGYSGSELNLETVSKGNTETMLCPCKNHKKLLSLPDSSTFSSNPIYIEITDKNKKVLLPGAGSAPILSKQVTTIRSRHHNVSEEHHVDINNPVEISDELSLSKYEVISQQQKIASSAPPDKESTLLPISFKPVYGSGLVVLPTRGAPLALNCPCTDRKDGTYRIVNFSNSADENVYDDNNDDEENVVVQRDLVNFLNANPVYALKLTKQGPDFLDSWLVTGKPLSFMTCKDESIVSIK